MTEMPQVCAVVLTYNSTGELTVCLEGLSRQVGVDLCIAVVDNASDAALLPSLIDEFRRQFPDGLITDPDKLDHPDAKSANALFVQNKHNGGYSSGNNIGGRFAAQIGCQAVLVVNPDMQITDPLYVKTLLDAMMADERCFVAGSRIRGLDGADQNGLREAGFWEELLWVRQLGPRWLRPKPYVTAPLGTDPLEVDKVSGCCQMIRVSFLQEVGFLDENVFLYCEEPILAAQVRAAGGRLMVFPNTEAIHAHLAGKKGNVGRRMQLFIKSRLYYLDNYADYGPLRRAALHLSYAILYRLQSLRAQRSS